MDTTTISVVIPVRNRPDKVVQAIRSVQAQSHPVDEIIIVDDASTDATPAILAREAAADRRIKVVHQSPQQGAAVARNIGAGDARGTWLAFLDSDDEWLPNKIERQLAAIATADTPVACFTGMIMVAADGRSTFDLPQSVSLADLRNANVLGSTSTALVSKSAFNSVHGFDEGLRSCQDWQLWLALAEMGTLLTLATPEVLFHEAGDDRISRNLDHVLQGHAVIFGRITTGMGFLEKRAVQSHHHNRLSAIYLRDMSRPYRALRHALTSFTLRPNRQAVHNVRSVVQHWCRVPRSLD